MKLSGGVPGQALAVPVVETGSSGAGPEAVGFSNGFPGDVGDDAPDGSAGLPAIQPSPWASKPMAARFVAGAPPVTPNPGGEKESGENCSPVEANSCAGAAPAGCVSLTFVSAFATAKANGFPWAS